MTETNAQHPVVLRMADMYPLDLGGYEGHRTRKCGDPGHVDLSRSNLNRQLIGDEDWVKQVQAEIAEMAQRNFVLELEKLEKRRRKTEALKRITEGPRDPWRKGRHGPLREVILTANRAWFEDGQTDQKRREREAQFERLAIGWLKEHFGEDVVHARADLDEAAYHIYAIIVPRSATSDGRVMLQPSKHAMIKDYEAAQDSVGDWFAEIGLRRGERRAKKIREAKRHNAKLKGKQAVQMEVPERRDHVSPRDWREAQEVELFEREQAIAHDKADITAQQKQVDTVVNLVRKVAEGKMDAVEAVDRDGNTFKPTAAAKLFGKAISVLRARIAPQEHDKLAKEYESIRAADDAIVEVASLLPGAARRKVVEARKSLVRRIIGLSTSLKALHRKAQNTSSRGGRGKD